MEGIRLSLIPSFLCHKDLDHFTVIMGNLRDMGHVSIGKRGGSMTYQIAFIDRDRSYALRCKEGLEDKTDGLMKIHFFSSWQQVKNMKEFFHPDLIVADSRPEDDLLSDLPLWPLYSMMNTEDDGSKTERPGLDQIITCLWTPRPGRSPGEIYRYQDLTGLQEDLFLALSFQETGDKVKKSNKLSLFLTPYRDFPLSSLAQSFAAYQVNRGERVFYWNRDPLLEMSSSSKEKSWSTLYLGLLSQKMNISLRIKMAESLDPRGFSYFPPPRSPGDGWTLGESDLKLVLSCLRSDYDRVVVDYPGQAFCYDSKTFGQADAYLCLLDQISSSSLAALLDDYLRIGQRPSLIVIGRERQKEKMKIAREKGFRASWINPFERSKDNLWKEVENDLFGGSTFHERRG